MTKKRLLSIGLLLAMVLSLLPMSALAAKIVIKSVTVSGIVSPVAGNEIPSFTCKDGVATSSDGTKLTVTSPDGKASIVRAFWGYAGAAAHSNTNYKTMPTWGNSNAAGGEFKPGESYYLWVLLGADENDNVMFGISDKLTSIKTANTKGKLMEFALQVGQTWGAPTNKNLDYVQDLIFDHGWGTGGPFTYTWVKFYFPVYTYITGGYQEPYPNSANAEVDVTWPETGMTPDFDVKTLDQAKSTDPDVYTATNVKWYPTATPAKTLKATDKFLAGVGYTAEFQLKTVDPYTQFTSDLYVEGPTGDVKVSNVTASSATCKIDFPVLDDFVTNVNLTGIQAPVAGQPKQTSGVTASGVQCRVSNVSVTGNFDSSGNYKAGETYTMRVELNSRDGYTFKTLTPSMVKVNTGTVTTAGLGEISPYVIVKLTAGGEKEKIDKGNITFDLSKGVYVVPEMSTGDSDILADTFALLAGENKIKTVSDGYQLNGSGITDVVVQTSAGTMTMKAGEATKQTGSVVLSLSQATIDSQIPAGGSYYSSVTFKFPGGGAPADLGKLSVDLTKGTFTIPGGEANGKAFEDTVKACSQVTYKTGDPSGLDLDKEGVSDVLLSWSGGSLLLDASSQTSVGGAFTLTPDKTAVMKLTEQGAPSYYSGITFQFPGGGVEPGGFDPTGLVNPFKDVAESDYFYVPVLWAYYTTPQVTVGISATRFGPDSTVTRGQCVTFLWRAMGEPEPSTTTNPFVDVKTSDYYYKAVLWAVEKNITVGVNANHFVPSQTCSTAHIITFLYRTLGVGSNGWYEEAGNWAQADHLLDDTGLTVSPKVDCPRAAVVTFLYRELA